MNHTNNPIIKHKAGLLNLAEELGNVSKASRLWVYPEIHSTATKSLLKDGGIDNLVNKSRRTANI